MNVVDADGAEWTVRRRWVPRFASNVKRRFERRTERGSPAMATAEVSTWLADLVPVLAVVGAVAALLFFAAPIIVEALLVVTLFVLGVIGRVVFRRPWTIEARCRDDGRRIERSAVGWRASSRAVRELAAEIGLA